MRLARGLRPMSWMSPIQPLWRPLALNQRMVVAGEVIEHPVPGPFLDAMRPLLRPGGTLRHHVQCVWSDQCGWVAYPTD